MSVHLKYLFYEISCISTASFGRQIWQILNFFYRCKSILTIQFIYLTKIGYLCKDWMLSLCTGLETQNLHFWVFVHLHGNILILLIPKMHNSFKAYKKKISWSLKPTLFALFLCLSKLLQLKQIYNVHEHKAFLLWINKQLVSWKWCPCTLF